ncbi:MAG: aconitate hydratase [Halobacteriota archaeon]
MGYSVTEKIVRDHLVEGETVPGEEVGLEVDQVLSQDTTGTMVWLQFEAMELEEPKTEIAGQYCDHQTYQFDFKNTDDHRFLKSASQKYGAWFSRPGNGICHQVHKENFAAPGKVLLGADSHTPTQGGLGMLSIGAGGLDIATAMGGSPYYVEMPEVVEVRLEGELSGWATAKDVILEMLRRLTVKGGVGKVFEYTGPGAESLSVPERCTITNMGTELGATSSVFPSDDVTRDYLRRLGREDDYVELQPDEDAEYDDSLVVDLDDLEPLVAEPSMPDKVVPVAEAEGIEVEQVIVGSCTNGAYEDVRAYADVVGDREVDEDVHAIVAPASKQAAEILAREGVVADLMSAGVNWSESTCGACIGIGHVPASDSASLRTFNRNFEGRSGIEDDDVYLCSPEVAAVATVTGEITDPRDYAGEFDVEPPGVVLPDGLGGRDPDLLDPNEAPDDVELKKGPNIGSVPLKDELDNEVAGEVILKVGDDITTDHIIPATSDILMYRSNIERLSDFTLSRVDEGFADRAREHGGGFVVGGENYGQGSSREHAALCPMNLGIEAVVAKSFARIHKANLINFGLLPLTFADADDYDAVDQGDSMRLAGARDAVDRDEEVTRATLVDESTGDEIEVELDASRRERDYLLAGGKLAYTKKRA